MSGKWNLFHHKLTLMFGLMMERRHYILETYQKLKNLCKAYVFLYEGFDNRQILCVCCDDEKRVLYLGYMQKTTKILRGLSCVMKDSISTKVFWFWWWIQKQCECGVFVLLSSYISPSVLGIICPPSGSFPCICEWWDELHFSSWDTLQQFAFLRPVYHVHVNDGMCYISFMTYSTMIKEFFTMWEFHYMAFETNIIVKAILLIACPPHT